MSTGKIPGSGSESKNSLPPPGKRVNSDSEFHSSDLRKSPMMLRDCYAASSHFPRSKVYPISENPKDLTTSSRPNGGQPLQSTSSQFPPRHENQGFVPRVPPQPMGQPWPTTEAIRPLPFPTEMIPLPGDLANSSTARSAFAALSTLAYSSLLRGQVLGFPFPPSSSLQMPSRSGLEPGIPATAEVRSGTGSHHSPTVPCPADYQISFSLPKGISKVGDLLPENLEYWCRQQHHLQQQQQHLNNRPLSTGPGSLPWLALNNGYSGTDQNSSAGRRKNATRETTSMLKAWLNEHRKNPYPTKSEKIMLAIITKMSLTQVSTWFANARRRLKKENKMTWTTRGTSVVPESPTCENGDTDDEVEEGVDSVEDVEEEMKAASGGLSGMDSLMDPVTLRRLFSQFTSVEQLVSGRPVGDAGRPPEEELFKSRGLTSHKQQQQLYRSPSFGGMSHNDRLPDSQQPQVDPGESAYKHLDIGKPFFTEAGFLTPSESSSKMAKGAPSKRKIWSLADFVQEGSAEDTTVNTTTTYDNSLDKSGNSPGESPPGNPGGHQSSPKRLHLLENDVFQSGLAPPPPPPAPSCESLANAIKSSGFLPPASLAALLMYIQHHSKQERLPEVIGATTAPTPQVYPGNLHCTRAQHPATDGC